MRYGCRPDSLLEAFAAACGQVPFPILDTIIPLVQARALMVASACNVFGALGERPATAPALAQRLQVDATTLEMLLRVLEPMDYTRRRAKGLWHLGRLGQRFFGTAAMLRFDGFLDYGPAQARFMTHMEEVLRTGKGIDFHGHQTPDDWRAYQRGMLENAKSFAWFIVRHTPVPRGAVSCLDIAGAHGYVSGTLAARHPPMRARVLDRAEALATSRTLGAGEAWHGLVEFQEGDLLRDDFGAQDVILLSNILHHFDADTNARIVQRAAQALKPGGVISIFDMERPEPTERPNAVGDCFALYFRIISSAACFHARDYVRWLQAARLRTRVVRSVRMPSRMLVIGSKD